MQNPFYGARLGASNRFSVEIDGARLGHTTMSRVAPLGGAGQLGDVICTEGDRLIGQNAVEQLTDYWFNTVNSVDAAGQNQLRAQFLSAVNAIKDQYDAADTWAARWIPFHPGACTIKAIGLQAQTLMAQIAAAAGQVTPGAPAPVAPPGLIPPNAADIALSALKYLLWGGATLALGYGAYRVGKKIYTETRRPATV